MPVSYTHLAFRFRKIGGWSAGVVAVIALLHDVAVIYFTFVVFRMPVDDNFIAVVLTILGYSLQDTIIIYDRIRENRRIMGPKAEIGELARSDEDVLSYVAFPQIAEKFLARRAEKEKNTVHYTIEEA